ncbi:MAG: FAD-dependent oxidoreductase [Acidobacteriaceae bacterium]|nr:FAD-dependent oxidoreductase [Acidobacteriaceae bacterium]
MTLPKSRNTPTAAILGGGIVGATIAWRLAQQGWHPSIFEKGSFGGEASWAGAGMLAPGGEIDAPSLLTDLILESRKLYPAFVNELQDESEIRIDYQECGALDLAYSEKEWRELQARAEKQRTLGIESHPISLAKIRSLWPFVRREDVFGALLYPGDAVVNPRDLMRALQIVLERKSNQVSIFQQTAAERVEIFSHHALVHSSSGIIRADAVVLAAGAWSSQIPLIGVERVPTSEPIKGHLISYRTEKRCCPTILRHGHTYILQRSEGPLIAGTSVERVGYDRTVSPEITRRIEESARFVLPCLLEEAPAQNWIGFRPGGNSLHIGSWQDLPLYLAYGHFRNGILLAPVTASRLVREMSLFGRDSARGVNGSPFRQAGSR